MAGFAIKGEISGLAEITATLKGLPDKLQRKVMRKALERATKPVVAAARRLVPTDTGLLKKSIARKVVTYKASGTLVVVIGPRTGMKRLVTRQGRRSPMLADPAKYGHLVEFGTKRHSLDAGAKAPRGKKRPADYQPVGRKIHPGTRAQPFLRPAFDETRGQVIAIFAAEVQEGLARELAKGVT